MREVISGSGAADRLDEVVARYRPGRILVVGSPRRVAATGVLDRLGGRPARVFDGFRANRSCPTCWPASECCTRSARTSSSASAAAPGWTPPR